eukprot:g32265.t1
MGSELKLSKFGEVTCFGAGSSWFTRLEWLHWALKSPKFDFQGFSDAQLRMKGDALAREKSLEGRSLQAALAHMYPSHRWLGDVQVEDVNRTCGEWVQGLELDIAVCIARAGESGGLMHEEEFEGGAAEDADEDEAVKEMRKTLEREVERCLGSLPALGLREEWRAAWMEGEARSAQNML